MAAPPPGDALVAFGVTDRPAALPGGRGTSWRAGATVLKPLDMPQEVLTWQDQILRAIATATAFRVAAPVRSADGWWSRGGRRADRLAGGERTHDWQAPYRAAVRIACVVAATS